MFKFLLSGNITYFSLLGLLCFQLTGCGISKQTTISDSSVLPSTQNESTDDSDIDQSPPLALNLASQGNNIMSVKGQLKSAHQEWKGTPYRHGGESSEGIDCSAFTQNVFRDYFEKVLPRDTRSQLMLGSVIRRRSIKTGDLIFFKTGRKSLHVGISIGEDQFLHASVSSGVMISDLSERYWATRFLGARRVL